jgi:hypothetical protein
MAGKPGDVPHNGSDKNETFKNEETRAEAAESLRQDAFKPSDIVQQKAEAPVERWDAKKIADTTEMLNKMIAGIQDKYFKPDASGTSIIDRMAQHAPELAQLASASYTRELVDPAKQVGADIKDTLEKMKKFTA